MSRQILKYVLLFSHPVGTLFANVSWPSANFQGVVVKLLIFDFWFQVKCVSFFLSRKDVLKKNKIDIVLPSTCFEMHFF